MFRSESCGVDVGISLTIDGEEIGPRDSRFSVALQQAGRGDLAGTLRLVVGQARGELFRVDEIAFTFMVPIEDIHGVRTPLSERGDVQHLPHHAQWLCGAQQGMPFVALTDRAGRNRFAFGLLDQTTETQIELDLLAPERAFVVTIKKPAGPAAIHVRRWREGLYLSKRDAQWGPTIRDYLAAASESGHYDAAPVPDWAFDPVFSTWYAVQQQVEPTWVERNAQIARDLGFGTLALDNGWFTPHRDGGCAYAGDWEPAEAIFPDLAAHVSRVQEAGMRYLLWTAPWVVGRRSQTHKTLRRLLTDVGASAYDVLCPRSAETHEHIAAMAKRLMADYGVDGLTLSLVDAVRPVACTGNHDHQFATVGDGMAAALRRLHAAVTEVRPEAVLSLAQSGANLPGRCCANALRVAQAPLDYDTNRWRIAALRSFAGEAAVHSDAIYWRIEDSPANLSRHLISALFAVPVLSAGLEWVPDIHREIIRHWIGFYTQHRTVLTRGRLRPVLDDCGHPLLAVVGEEAAVVAVFSDAVATLYVPQTVRTIYLLNASNSEDVCLRLEGVAAQLECETFDPLGSPSGEQLGARPPYVRLTLPVGAHARLTQA